jgi:hypothetical protein
MNEYWFLAFVATPALILLIAYLGVIHFEWTLDRKGQIPDE